MRPSRAVAQSLGRATVGVGRIWRSPPDQPAWARPALITIATLAGLLYAWGMNGAALEVYYGAAARSMSTSWHNFFFAACDPAGTITIDKLPGSIWPQALLLRIFGFHVWAIVLPQVLEGVVTILVLYRAVQRLAGPLAGIVAAAAVATSPVTVALNRGNVADSLLIMLLVFAADATSAALLSGRRRSLLLAGVWVGLAFQAKMTVAWLVLPALASAYLLAAPPRLRTRIGHVALAGLVTALVSMSWMIVVSLVPSHSRPYVDGTQNNSLFSQTFEYNGSSRLGGSNVFAGLGHPAPFLVRISETNASPAHRVRPSWHRLLSGLFGRDDGWLIPAALLSAACVLYLRRGERRRDPLRASAVLWGGWFVVMAAFFSAGGYPNSYYVAALSPAIGALCGAGAALVQRAASRFATVGLTLALLSSVTYGIYLLDDAARVPTWLAPIAAIAALATAALLALRRGAPLATPTRMVVMVLSAGLILPGVTSALMTIRGLGPFAAPYEPAAATTSRADAKRSSTQNVHVMEQLAERYDTPILLATDSSILAAPFILATGKEVLPIGGFQGGAPSPSLPDLQRRITAGEIGASLVPVVSDDPRIVWIRSHCKALESPEGRDRATSTALYDCSSA